jgi:hypothetical protein
VEVELVDEDNEEDEVIKHLIAENFKLSRKSSTGGNQESLIKKIEEKVNSIHENQFGLLIRQIENRRSSGFQVFNFSNETPAFNEEVNDSHAK